jgi:hypothetical protein
MQDDWQLSAYLLQQHPKGISTSVRFQVHAGVLLKIKVLNFVDCASLYSFMEVTNLMHFFMYLFIFSSLLTGIPNSHLHKLIIPDDVLIHFDLLMMSIMMLETCRELQ